MPDGDFMTDYRNKRLILVVMLFGLLGISASVGAAYFLTGGNATGLAEKFRAAIGGSAQIRESSRQANTGATLPFRLPRLSQRSDSQAPPEKSPAAESQSAPNPQSSPSQTPTAKFGKILISEAQIAGNAAGDEFIEFYNPNDFAVSLEGWSVKKKTATGNEYAMISTTVFKGKTIAAKSYFLAARSEAEIPAVPDIWWAKSNTLAENNTIVLYGKFGDETVIVDALGWGDAYEFEGSPAPNPAKGETLARKSANDTDNNAADFIISTPTPRNAASGTGFSSPPAAPSPQPSPSPSQSPVPTPSSSPESSPTPNPEASPTPMPSSSPIPSPSPTPPPSPSPSPEPSPTPAALKILINEVQIAGVTATDEFIELYNPNYFPIDLAGWALKKKTASGNESNLVAKASFGGTIPANGFFLVTHQAGYVGSVAPDLRYSGASYSIAADNTVILYANDDTISDKVGFGSASDVETAAAQNPESGKSIQRKNFQDTGNNAADFELNYSPSPTNSNM